MNTYKKKYKKKQMWNEYLQKSGRVREIFVLLIFNNIVSNLEYLRYKTMDECVIVKNFVSFCM
jgi:hypothetical protein